MRSIIKIIVAAAALCSCANPNTKSKMETKSADMEKDKQTLIAIVKEMTESMTGAQSTKHWAEDVLWFDIPAFASKGIAPAVQKFDLEFGKLAACKIEILDIEVTVNGNMGIACTVQRFSTVGKNGVANPPKLARQTDCFEKR
ncbi:MAG: hypothetical protein LBS94_04430, partial [Prevotellaceae bacterium]|nr:hypothetical protein [Prevotellaceae bacterium]